MSRSVLTRLERLEQAMDSRKGAVMAVVMCGREVAKHPIEGTEDITVVLNIPETYAGTCEEWLH